MFVKKGHTVSNKSTSTQQPPIILLSYTSKIDLLVISKTSSGKFIDNFHCIYNKIVSGNMQKKPQQNSKTQPPSNIYEKFIFFKVALILIVAVCESVIAGIEKIKPCKQSQPGWNTRRPSTVCVKALLKFVVVCTQRTSQQLTHTPTAKTAQQFSRNANLFVPLNFFPFNKKLQEVHNFSIHVFC